VSYNQIAYSIFASLLSTSATAAFAQELDHSGIEDIIVTAQKREESLQNTPISIVALSGRELEARQINGLNDLRSNVPNLQLTPHPNSAATTQVFMRGVGLNDDQITQDPSTAVYMDGVYIARSQGLAMDVAELERVEVLRGPQGTLYGRNATGGAINFITRKPTLGQFEGKLQAGYGNYDAYRLKGSINIPVGDSVAIGLSYLRAGKDGFVSNRGLGASRFGDQKREAWRADVYWEASPDFSARYSYDRSEIGDTPTYITQVPLFPGNAARPTESATTVASLLANDVTSQGHSLTLDWTMNSDLTIRSITAYRKLDNFQNQDYLSGALRPQALQRNQSDAKQDQFSQEIQLIGSTANDSIKYVVGGYLFTEEGENYAVNLPTTTATKTYTDAEIKNSSYALFAQATWTPADVEQLHITLGARYSRDKRAANLRTASQVDGSPITQLINGSGSNTFKDFSPSLIIAYDLSDNVNAYAKAVKGYKTGGFNTRASSVASFNRGFGDETLWSYEAGLKTQTFDNKLRFNIAGFISKYSDIQVNVQVDPLNIRLTDVLNAGKADVKGIEADLTLAPARSIRLNANYGYLDTKYKRIIDGLGNDVSNAFRFVNAPKHSFNLDGTYTSPDLGIGSVEANINYAWQSKRFSSSDVAAGRYIIPAYGLLNARLSLINLPVAKDMRVGIYGRNILDKEYYIAHFNVGIPGAVYGDPRSYGIDVSLNF
jgi:iron complex outermembrane receptor protein